jgi:AbrB family looped-hinge helix DNA binding protein
MSMHPLDTLLWTIDNAMRALYDIHNRKEGVHMSEPTTISSKGQVTVPRDVRERLGLQAGDKIAWSMLSNGTIVLRPKTRRLADLVGILTQPGQPGVSVDEMRLPE